MHTFPTWYFWIHWLHIRSKCKWRTYPFSWCRITIHRCFTYKNDHFYLQTKINIGILGAYSKKLLLWCTCIVQFTLNDVIHRQKNAIAMRNFKKKNWNQLNSAFGWRRLIMNGIISLWLIFVPHYLYPRITDHCDHLDVSTQVVKLRQLPKMNSK